MMEFIYNLVKEFKCVSENVIIRSVLNEYEWYGYSRWQMRRTVIDKLKFLCDVGLLNVDVVRKKIESKDEYKFVKYYSISEYNVDKFPKIRLRCKLGAMFYGGRRGVGILYPLFRFEKLFFDVDDDSEYVIDVHYDGFEARECHKYLTEIVKEELSKLYKR